MSFRKFAKIFALVLTMNFLGAAVWAAENSAIRTKSKCETVNTRQGVTKVDKGDNKKPASKSTAVETR